VPKQSKVGDIGVGVCFNHEVPTPFVTTITGGAKTAAANGLESAIISSPGVATCGCSTTAISGSKSVLKEGLGCHRLGDIGVTGGGMYVMVSASGNIDIGS